MKYIILIIATSTCCFAQPYFKSTDFKFKVKYTNAQGPKTMELNSVDNRRAGIMDSVEWVYNEYNLIKYSPVYCKQDSLGVMITSPKRGDFATTENVPNPEVKFPVNIGDSIYVEQPLSDGKIMKGYLKVTEKLKFGYYLNQINYVWKIEAHNLDDDRYSAIYYYDKKNGFVYFNYKLANLEIEMDYGGAIIKGYADEHGAKYKDSEKW